MSIKAMVLEGGETILANVKEVHDKEKQEFLGYRVENPYVTHIEWGNKTETPVEDTAVIGNSDEGEVKFSFWAPLAAEREFDFVKDFVRVIYEPHEDTVKLYMAVLAHHQEQYTKSVTVDTSKTIVTMVGDDDPTQALGGKDVAPGSNTAFDS